MKTKTLILTVSAVTLAAGAALAGRALMRPPPPVTIIKEVPVVRAPDTPLGAVLKVSDTLTAGQYLKPDRLIKTQTLTWQETPDERIDADALVAANAQERRRIERELAGAALRATLSPGQALTRDALVYPTEPGFLATVLQPGMRAVAIPTSAVASNAGLVGPDDRVDVILSLQRSELEAPAQAMPNGTYYALAAQTIVRNVRVLALNNNATAVTPQDEPSASPTDASAKTNPRLAPAPNTLFYESLTLEVTPAEAELLALAREVGSLQVALLSAHDDSPAVTTATREVTRFREVSALFESTRSASRVVNVYRGATQATQVFGNRP